MATRFACDALKWQGDSYDQTSLLPVRDLECATTIDHQLTDVA